jgi:hypothetical protein
MKELDLSVFLAVFEEMFGIWLWIGLGGVVVAIVALIVVLVRDHGIRPRRLVWAEVVAVAGGVAAVLIMQQVTHSGFRDIGGPIDWVVGIAIFGAGAVGTLVAVYAALGLTRRLG